MKIITTALLFFSIGTYAYCGNASLSGTSYSIMLDDAVIYMDGTSVKFYFTTYDGNRDTYPYYFDSVNGIIYYSREVKKIGSLYYTDYYSLIGNTIDDIGEIVMSFENNDTNANGIDDICELDKSANIQLSGNWYSVTGKSGDISGSMIRNGNSHVGYYSLSLKDTWAGDIPASGEFHIGSLSGNVNYSNSNSTLTITYSSTWDSETSFEPGQTTYEIIDCDTVRIYGVDDFPTTDFIRIGNKYSATLELSDGSEDSFWPDYQKWNIVIQDLNDSDGDGIPDLSDPAEPEPKSTPMPWIPMLLLD